MACVQEGIENIFQNEVHAIKKNSIGHIHNYEYVQWSFFSRCHKITKPTSSLSPNI